MPPLSGIRVCLFDAYGTLFDFAAAAASCRDVLGERAAALITLWRDKQIQYTWLRSLQHLLADFWQVTGDALGHALETQRRLRAAGLRTAILYNGTPAMLAAAVAGNGLGDRLDAVISIEEVGVYKTDPRVYQHAIDRLGVRAEEVSFQSSNAWDAHAASAFGMRVVWCNRYGQKPERLPGKSDFEIQTLAALPALLGA